MKPNILIMDPKREESETSETEEQFPLNAAEDDEEGGEGEEEDEEDEEDEEEEEDAMIFNAWMLQYRRGEHQRKPGGEEDVDEKAEDEEEMEKRGRPGGRSSLEPPVRMRIDRRASLPCPATLSTMQLSRLHSSSGAAVTARVLLHRTSSRRLLPSPQEAPSPVATHKPVLERRLSFISTIPETVPTERRSQFRRRNVMSLSDAYSVCLICHNDLNQGSGTRELECTHTFHKECIEEWLLGKQSCPTCRVQVSLRQPVYDLFKVP